MMERSKCMNIPKVRFHGFKEKWREESLSKLFVERHEISTITESLPQLSFTISEGVIYPNDRKSNKRDFLIKDITNKKYLVTYVGDIIYNPANVIYGAIHRNSLCNGVVSPIYKIFKTEQDSNFMECVVRNPSFISQLSMKTEGTVTKLKTLKPESFLEMIVKIAPSIDEQQKIASYFQSLDSLIQTTSKKLASLNLIKAASLQSMFPQEGETVPKVRFKGFEREWEPVKLSKIGYMTAGGTPSTFVDKYWNGEINWLQSGIVQNRIIYTSSVERKITAEGLSNSAAHMIKKDSVLIAITGATCANIGYLTFESAANQSVVSIEPNNNFYSKFIYSSLISERSQILSFKGGSAQSGVTLANLKEILLKCPSFGEQVFIGDYFFSLEKNIELLTQRLEKLKQIKVACLDKMFV